MIFQIQQDLKLRRAGPTALPPVEMEGTAVPGGGYVKHFNQEAFVDLMQSCDWTQGPSADVPRAPRMVRRPAGCHGNAAMVGFQQMEEDFSKREREAYEDKQRMREASFESKLAAAKEDLARRHRERSAAKERDFAQRLEEFQQRSQRIIAESGHLVHESEMQREKKRERLFKEWTNKVFEPEQRQIQDHLQSIDAADVTAKRRVLFDKFLAAANSKKCGLFRDIIIESQYDPVGDMKQASMRFKKVPAKDDPTLTRMLREDADPIIQEVRRKAHGLEPPSSSSLNNGSSKSRTSVSVQQWATIGDTTYGRYSAEAGNKRGGGGGGGGRPRPVDNFKIDHYDVLTGEAAVQQLRKEGYHIRKHTRAQIGSNALPSLNQSEDKK